jgi:tetratricopeptide (TPR) repeat protein
MRVSKSAFITLIIIFTASWSAASADEHGFPGRGNPATWNNAIHLFNKALKLHDAHNIDGAIALYQQAIQTYPYDPDFYSNLALIYENDKREFDTAETLLRKAITLAPKSAMYRLGYAGLLFDERKYSQSKVALQDAEKYAKTDADRAKVKKLKNLLNSERTENHG